MPDFSFTPDPRYGWGSQLNIGRSLLNSMTQGLDLQGALDRQKYESARNDMNLHLLPQAGEDMYWRYRDDSGSHQADNIMRDAAMQQFAATGAYNPQDYATPYGQYTHPMLAPHPLGPAVTPGPATAATSGLVPGTTAANGYGQPVAHPAQTGYTADPYAAQYAIDPLSLAYSGG